MQVSNLITFNFPTESLCTKKLCKKTANFLTVNCIPAETSYACVHTSDPCTAHSCIAVFNCFNQFISCYELANTPLCFQMADKLLAAFSLHSTLAYFVAQNNAVEERR